MRHVGFHDRLGAGGVLGEQLAETDISVEPQPVGETGVRGVQVDHEHALARDVGHGGGEPERHRRHALARKCRHQHHAPELGPRGLEREHDFELFVLLTPLRHVHVRGRRK